MSFWWLVVLIGCGLISGWDHVRPLDWWLLLPLFVQDLYDGTRKPRG